MKIVLTQMLELLGIYVCLIVLLVLLLLAVVKILKRAGRKVPRHLSGTAGRFAVAAFVAYLMLLVYLTLCSNMFMSSGAGGVNLVPFQDLQWPLSIMQQYSVFGNIFLFVPFGLLFNTVFAKSFWKPAAGSLLLSVCIEDIQLFIGRTCDINDVLFNTLGGLFGIALYYGFACLYRFARRKIKK